MSRPLSIENADLSTSEGKRILQGVLEDIYTSFSDLRQTVALKSDPVIVTGTTRGRSYVISANDSDATNVTAVLTSVGG